MENNSANNSSNPESNELSRREFGKRLTKATVMMTTSAAIMRFGVGKAYADSGNYTYSTSFSATPSATNPYTYSNGISQPVRS